MLRLTRRHPHAAAPARRIHVYAIEPLEDRRFLSVTLPGGSAVNEYGNPIASLVNAAVRREVPAAFNEFRVFSALRSPDVPDVTAAGLAAIKVSYHDIYPLDDEGRPIMTRLDEAKVRQRAREASDRGVPYVLDIEHWTTDVRADGPEAVRVTMRQLEQLVGWVRDERPEVALGFYGIFPLRNYNDPVALARLDQLVRENPNHDPGGVQRAALEGDMREWRAANNFLKPLAALADFIVPSLYAFYPEPGDWAVYATANIAEAKRYGKPVVPFLWPRYHPSNGVEGGQTIDGAFFGEQLRRTLDAGADGVVVWGGLSMKVDESEAWWRETVAFAADLGGQPDGGPGGQRG